MLAQSQTTLTRSPYPHLEEARRLLLALREEARLQQRRKLEQWLALLDLLLADLWSQLEE